MNNDPPPADLQALLGTDHAPSWWKRASLWIVLALLAIGAAGFYYWQRQQTSQAAANAELLARQRYSSGLIDFATVLSTQRNLLAAQDSVASTQASLSADHVRLYKALGGGWRPEAESPAALPLAARP